MESKHTPGPWEFSPHDDPSRLSGDRFIHAAGQAVKHSCNWLVSVRPIIDNADDARSLLKADMERDANARLIAAAPELLAALREAKAQIIYLHDKFFVTGLGTQTLARIDAAIARAEGGK